MAPLQKNWGTPKLLQKKKRKKGEKKRGKQKARAQANALTNCSTDCVSADCDSLWYFFFKVLLNLLAQSSTAAAVCENKTLQKTDLSYNEIGLEGAKNIGYCVCENQDFTESGFEL